MPNFLKARFTDINNSGVLGLFYKISPTLKIMKLVEDVNENAVLN